MANAAEAKATCDAMTVGEAITRLQENLAQLEQTTGKDASKVIQELGKLYQSLTKGQLDILLEELPKEVDTTRDKDRSPK